MYAGHVVGDDGVELVWATPRSTVIDGFALRVRHGPPAWWRPKVGVIDSTTPGWRIFRAGWLHTVFEVAWKRAGVMP